jgi:hypothetical protein
MLAALLVAAAADAACPNPRSTADLMSALDEAKAAYGDLDVDGFRAAIDRARADLPCVTDEVTPHLAAELHRHEGLLAFFDRQPDRSTTAFAAARRIEPDYRFPESLVPAGNPVLDDYGALDPDGGKVERVPEPASGRLALDGRTSTGRSRSFPTVAQLFDDGGQVTLTAYLWPTDPLPSYAPKPEAPPPVAEGGWRPDRRDRRFLLGAGASLAASAALYAGALAVHARYDDDATPIDRLDRLRAANNGLVLASGVSLAVGVSLGTAAFVAEF